MSIHNLPSQPTQFVGRAPELAEIAALLDDPACRLVTLLGPGGIGKTRLALETATTHLETYPDGVFFVALQSISSPDHIVSTIGEAMGLRFYPGDDIKRQLLDSLCDKVVLLVLDNFEHVVDGAMLAADILAMSDGIKIIATSRVALNLQEEWIYSVNGMRFPTEDADTDLEAFSATRLFIQCARRARTDFSIDEERAGIIRICRALDGMPLGIELAATWVRSLSCGEIADEIGRGLDILEATTRNVSSRHRSMRVVLDGSWTLLSAQEQTLFKRLSIFRGGFTRDAAEVVAGASLRTLAALVDKSFLRHEMSGRYAVHELLRQYGEEHLNQTPDEAQAVGERHCDYYRDFLFDHADGILRTNERAAFLAIDEELDNVRLAWQRMITRRNLDGLVTASNLISHHHFGRGLYAEVETTMNQAMEQLAGRSPLLLAWLQTLKWRGAQFLSRFEEARQGYRESLAVFRHYRNVDMSWEIICWLSETERALGNYEEAKHLGEEAQQFETYGDENNWLKTFSLANLAQIAYLMGDYAEAEAIGRRSLDVALKGGTKIGAADAWNGLGSIHLALHAAQEALNDFESALRVSRDIGYEMGVMRALSGLAETTFRSSALDQSKAYLYEAFHFAVVSHFPPELILQALVIAAEVLMTERQYASSARLLDIAHRHPTSLVQTRERAEALLDQLAAVHDVVPDAPADLPRLEQVAKGLLENELSGEARAINGNGAGGDVLNEREREILQLIADGLSNREIAAQLYLALGTVKWYINQIYGKLHVASRTQAVAAARETQLIS
ncbi:MAG: tetratricopeptide repeat protein [Anaerolineae bacterium]|nr:tetratricopeptide repeat protein [Anaerolineae bacterium]